MMRHLLRWTCKRRLARKNPLYTGCSSHCHSFSVFVCTWGQSKAAGMMSSAKSFQYLQAGNCSNQTWPTMVCNPFTSYLPCRVQRIAKDSHKINIETYWNRNDEFVESSQCAEVLGEASLPPAKTPSIVLFDGRGHGNSSGWTGGGPEQFHWKSLGLDMLQVAGAHRTCLSQPWAPSYIFGGCSMGAAAAVSSMQSVNS